MRLRKARRGKVRFAYSMQVKLLDDYCLAIGGTRASCTRIYKAEG